MRRLFLASRLGRRRVVCAGTACAVADAIVLRRHNPKIERIEAVERNGAVHYEIEFAEAADLELELDAGRAVRLGLGSAVCAGDGRTGGDLQHFRRGGDASTAKQPKDPGTHAMSDRILLIEDDEQIADSLVRGLSEEGYAVERRADGDSGRLAMLDGPWALIILDWWLPGCDGLTLLRRYRQGGGDAPVLFLTARDSISDRVRGLDCGADDYLCKPFDFDELLARVRARVRRVGHGVGGVLTYRDLVVDLVGGKAERAGAPLDLTPKETALLAFFLRRPGEVLTRSRIYDHVWDEAYEGASNTLEFHVVELRRKLEAHGPRLIHTLRGRGYLFGDPPGGTG